MGDLARMLRTGLELDPSTLQVCIVVVCGTLIVLTFRITSVIASIVDRAKSARFNGNGAEFRFRDDPAK